MANLDLEAREYASAAGFEGDWRDSWWNPDFLDLMAKRWRLSERRAALDVGAGHGHWGQALFRRMDPSARLIGIDHEPDFCTAARERAAQKGLGHRVGYLRGDAMHLPFNDDRFDFVTCQTLMIHVAQPERVITEMLRVLRPGGCMALVEPNNQALHATWLLSEPRPSREDYLTLLELQWFCEQGKIALNEGDSSIGERLPGMLAARGLDVQVYASDRCPALVPPYGDEKSRAELEVLVGWVRDGVYAPLGPRRIVERLYGAGGGDPTRFEHYWSAAARRMEQFLDAVEQGSFHGARGLTFYLVSAEKPEAQRQDELPPLPSRPE